MHTRLLVVQARSVPVEPGPSEEASVPTEYCAFLCALQKLKSPDLLCVLLWITPPPVFSEARVEEQKWTLVQKKKEVENGKKVSFKMGTFDLSETHTTKSKTNPNCF